MRCVILRRRSGKVEQWSKETTLREGQALRSAHDEVIENADIDERQSVFQTMSDQLISLAGVFYAAGMIVREHHCRCIARESFSNALARVNRSAIHGPTEEFLERYESMPIVQVEATEDFIRLVAKLSDQERPSCRRRLKRLIPAKLFKVMPLRELQRHRYGGALQS